MKPFLSIEDQICLLKKRGLTIQNEELAANTLLTYSYYKIINGYAKTFQQPKTDKYVSGATFDEVYQLFFLDQAIRSTVLRNIIKVEMKVKSITFYYFSEYYRDDYAYLDPKNYIDSEKSLSTISSISRSLSYSITKDDSIRHHFSKYKKVPLWVLADTLDFGTLNKFYDSLELTVANKIARKISELYNLNYGHNEKIQPGQMHNMLQSISFVRNKCAHDAKLFDTTFIRNTPYFDQIHGPYMKNNKQHPSLRKLFSIYLMMRIFLKPTEFDILTNSLRKKFIIAEKKVSAVSIDRILDGYGFPPQWHKDIRDDHTKELTYLF